MPDFSRDERMPSMNQGPIPSSSHAPIQRERRFSGPSESSAKPARYPGVYQRPPPADYYRSTSPSHQHYRWPPPAPLDEPAHPPLHPGYRRETWDYRYREPGAGPPSSSFPPIRSPSPFPEWVRPPPPPPQGWSPRHGPEDSWPPPRRDWDERESGQVYGPSHSWDRPLSPLPPRDWQPSHYDRPPLPGGQSRGSPPLIREPGWGREPHFDQYDRDMREEWIRPDGWTDEGDIGNRSYSNPAHPIPYAPPNRTRGRSFAQDRRAPQPSTSGYNHPPAQPSPRGPGHVPLDSVNRRHAQHDRRYSGPGYGGEGRPFVPNSAPRRQFHSGRGSFNDPNHLQSRGAKLVPRDQLLVANTSIKVEDPDTHSITPTPASTTSSSPEKGALSGKRSRTDSVAAEAEPASRRPSPFASSATTTANPTTATSTTDSSDKEPQPIVPSAEQTDLPNAESGANVHSWVDDKVLTGTLPIQEQRVYAEPNVVFEPVTVTEDSVPAIAQSDVHITPIEEIPGGDSSMVVAGDAQGAGTDEATMDSEPPTAPLAQPLPDVKSIDRSATEPIADVDSSITELQIGDLSSEVDKESQLPLLQFEYLEFSDDEKENVPPPCVRDAITLHRYDIDKLALNIENVLQTNLTLASHRQPIAAVSEDIPTLDIFSMPDDNTQSEFGNLLREEFSEREEYVETKLGSLEEEYLTLNEAWTQYCLKLDEAAEKRRVRDATAAAAAAQNVISEPVAAQTRSTRRNPVVNAGVMADAVHSDLEMEKVMSNMRDAAAVDPDLLARPNLARIPDMVTVTEPEMLRFTYDDENGQVDDPFEFYDFKGRAAEHWTAEERAIFIEQHRVFNKRFDKIAEHLPYKTTSQCVKYYYLMKKVPAFRAQVKRGQRRRLGRGGHQGKASALMADIEKEEDGTTASQDEFIATRRSRRHAAATANANAAAAAAAQASTPPPSTAVHTPKPLRPRVVELARANSFETDRGGTSTPMSFASDSEAGGDVPHPSDLDLLLSTQPLRKGGPGRGRRWAYKGEVPNGSGGSVRLDGAEPSKKRPATTSYWTVAERTMLKQNLLRHGRDWNQISGVIQTKTAIQAKNYYFNNQKEMSVFVRAWEKEQTNEQGQNDSDHTSERLEVSVSASVSPAPTTKKDEPKKTTTPVTIQPAPGQLALNTTFNMTQSSKASSGRGNAHYPNVIPQPPLPQQQVWAKTSAPPKPKPPVAAPSQIPVIPTSPLPLPGPTFRAWTTAVAPPPPPIGYAFGSFPGVSGPGGMKIGPATVAPGPSGPRPSATATTSGNTASSSSSSNGGAQRGNPNHYPGPMRYQPYPVTATTPGGSVSGASKGKPQLTRPGVIQPKTMGAGPIKLTASTSVGGSAGPPRITMPSTSSGHFTVWNGEGKGKKPA